jgi:clostripain
MKIRKMSALILMAFVMSFFIACADIEEGSSPQSTSIVEVTPAPQTKWLVMVYSDADDEVLENDMFIDINEMELIGSTDNVTMVAQIDRHEDFLDDDWHNTRRYRITQDDDLDTINSELVADLGEQNMADPQTLIDFVTWSIQTYPAERYALILSDHGMGWIGGWSDPNPGNPGPDGLEITADGDLLLLNEIDDALGTIRQQTGVERFDLVGFDACLMGHLEVAVAVAPHANVMVASQELEPAMGWAYTAFLDELANNPAMDGTQLARQIVSTYIDQDIRITDTTARNRLIQENWESPDGITKEVVIANFSDDITLSAYDLTVLPSFMETFDTFIVALADAPQRAVIQAARNAQQFENIFDDNNSPYIDLHNFASILVDANPDETSLTDASTNLQTAISELVITNKYGPSRPGANGISIHFPNSTLYESTIAGASVYNQISARFTNEHRWDDFLAFHYYQTPLGDTPATNNTLTAPGASEITVSDIILSAETISTAESSTLSASVTGENIGFVYSFTGYYNPDDDTILVVDRDYIDAGKTRTVDGVYYPNWQGTDIEIEFEWEPILYSIDDGRGSVAAVLLDPQDYGTTRGYPTYIVEGRYTSANGKSREARLFFKKGELIKVLSLGNSRSASTPRVITPRAGDTFTIYNLIIDLYSDDDTKPVEYRYEDGDTLTFGDTKWSITEFTAPTGSYVVGIQADDMDGNRYENYAVITVDE